MDSPVMEEHIKYEAEESEHLGDHVWEEVVIDDTSEMCETQDTVYDDNPVKPDSGYEPVLNENAPETASENATQHVYKTETQEQAGENRADDVYNEVTEETEDDNGLESAYTNEIEEEEVADENGTLEKNDENDIEMEQEEAAEMESAEVDVEGEEDDWEGEEQPPQSTLGHITNVRSIAHITKPPLAKPPLAKLINLHHSPHLVKILPKGGYINIGNKKMKLVTLTGDKKLVAGKVVTVANTGGRLAAGKIVTGKVITLSNPDKKMGFTLPTNQAINATNKVVPAKVVSIANSNLKPLSPASKEVTIYITGRAGDKVEIKQEVQKRESWKSDHIDACLPVNDAPTDTEMDSAEAQVTEGHFLLNQQYDSANLTCNICERSFTQLKYLLSHQQTHILTEPVNCDTCNRSFKRRYDLLRHKRRAHAQDTQYQCEVCLQTFTDRVEANKHRLTHTEDFKCICEVCHRPFKYIQDLKRHRSIHFDEKPFDCEICGKKFKHKSNLKTHQATHYSEKPFACTLCEKRFHQKGNLKTHLIVHTGEMPFVCNICNKRFHTRSGLLNHSYSHSDEKPFQCEVCEKTFNWKSGLLTHQQTHRQGTIRPHPTYIPEDVQVIEIGPIPVDN